MYIQIISQRNFRPPLDLWNDTRRTKCTARRSLINFRPALATLALRIGCVFFQPFYHPVGREDDDVIQNDGRDEERDQRVDNGSVLELGSVQGEIQLVEVRLTPKYSQ